MKHLRIEYTTEGGNKIVLFNGEVAEVIWSDSAAGVRVEGKTQAAAAGMNLLDLLTGGKNRAEEKPEATPKAAAAPRKAAPRKVVEADSIEVIQAAQG